ncbi:MAG: hypothetical protein ACE5EV_00730, partial [Gaiellales bacterium]
VQYRVPVSGVEIWATDHVGTFVGSSSGPLLGVWRTSVRHTALRRRADITGGSYEVNARLGGDVRRIRGTFTGGTVQLIPRARTKPCANERFRVTPAGAAARGRLTLTHYRHQVFGRCLIYGASLRGTMWLRVAEDGPGSHGGLLGSTRSRIESALGIVGGWLGGILH